MKLLFLVLRMERESLYARINARVDKMMAEGLVEETKSLLDSGYHWMLSQCAALVTDK